MLKCAVLLLLLGVWQMPAYAAGGAGGLIPDAQIGNICTAIRSLIIYSPRNVVRLNELCGTSEALNTTINSGVDGLVSLQELMQSVREDYYKELAGPPDWGPMKSMRTK